MSASAHAAPELVSGPGTIADLPAVVEDGRWRRVLLVCGERSFQASGAAAVLPDLEKVAEVTRWSDFDPNTDADDLLRGLGIVRESAPDVIVGVGGGSNMDMAKLLCAFPDVTGREALHTGIRTGVPAAVRRTGLVLVPTTAGSGSEATHFAVVYIGEEKHSVAAQGLRPDAVILDPQLLLSATPYQRATSGIDAVCQAIESLWATGADATSRRFARRALRHLLPTIEGFVDDGGVEEATAMSTGAHLAGRAIDISKTTAAHAMSYAITQRYGVSHGHAVALTLGPFLAAHADADDDRLRDGLDLTTHRGVMKDLLDRFDASDGEEADERFRELLRRIGLETRLSEVGVGTAEERRGLAEAVNAERLGNNPLTFDREGLLAILERAA